MSFNASLQCVIIKTDPAVNTSPPEHNSAFTCAPIVGTPTVLLAWTLEHTDSHEILVLQSIHSRAARDVLFDSFQQWHSALSLLRRHFNVWQPEDRVTEATHGHRCVDWDRVWLAEEP